MDHSKVTTDAKVSSRDAPPPEILVSSPPSDEPINNHSVHSDGQLPGPSAPPLPLYSKNSVPQDLEPPSYSSVVAQDSADWKISAGSKLRLNNPPPYPADGGAASRLGDVEEVITAQPKSANMNVRDYDAMQEAPSSENDDTKQRRKLATTLLKTVNVVNTNASRNTNSDAECADCYCTVAQVPVSHDHYGNHDSSCCFGDSSDGCCNGNDNDDGCCNGDGNDDCCDDGCCDNCCDDGCGDLSCFD